MKKIVCVVLSLIILLFACTAVYAYENDYVGVAMLFEYGTTLGVIQYACLDNLIELDYNIGEYLDNSAADTYSVMPTTEIIIQLANGAPGLIYCVDNEGETSVLCGDTNNTGYDYPSIDRALSNMPYYSPKTNILTMYLSSRAALTPDPIPDSSQLTGYVYPANLITQSVARYSQCAVGWQTNLDANSKIPWFTLFTSYAREHSVAESVEYATVQIGYEEYAWGEAYERCIIRGNGSVMLDQR